MSGARYVCIHGHFYQPPRESPWLEVVERQESAQPFHDWNERVHAECYGPNAAARILDAQGRIERIVNNYASISFNFGPTLLSWMEEARPEVYDAIVAADRRARETKGGPGSALAQVYGHVILPLANERDQRTQVIWGVRDFERRFGRKPKGMWLSETACDIASLEALAEQGIEFTVLAPHQCRRVRSDNDRTWHDVTGARVDTRRPYRIDLPSGRSIVAFFYDGPTSRAVAFERLLDDGAVFARRLKSLLDPHRNEPQVVHIATDGETYGHHHRFGEMALAYAITLLEKDAGVELVTYEEFLARHPPTWKAEIVPSTSWSCAHGVERWRSDCGCKTGGPMHWSQAWRAPLRASLDWLRDQLIGVFEREGALLFRDPWAARDGYVDVVLDRSDANVRAFLDAQRRTDVPWGEAEDVRALRALEMQRHAMLMYTSCGWFFDDLGGIETVQVIQYAARAIQLAQELGTEGLEAPFLERLAHARSNRPELGDGEEIYEDLVRPAMVDLRKVGAHFAASSLFEEYRDTERIFGFDVDVLERDHARAGQARLAIGRIRVRSRVTWASQDLAYAVVHLGDQNLVGGARPWDGTGGAHATMRAELVAAFGRADIAEVLRALERHFPGATYSLRTLFKDEQKKILDEVLGSTLEGVEQDYGQIYGQFAPLMRYLASLGQPVPRALHQAAEYTLTARLRREIDRARDMDLEVAEEIVREARDAGVTLELEELGRSAQRALEELLDGLRRDPDDLELLESTAGLAAFTTRALLRMDPARAQNRFYALRETVWAERHGSTRDDGWTRTFRALGAELGVKVDP